VVGHGDAGRPGESCEQFESLCLWQSVEVLKGEVGLASDRSQTKTAASFNSSASRNSAARMYWAGGSCTSRRMTTEVSRW
jgi:hypothetical protein